MAKPVIDPFTGELTQKPSRELMTVSTPAPINRNLVYDKSEVDAKFAALNLGRFVLKAGDTMTGDLTLLKSGSTLNLRIYSTNASDYLNVSNQGGYGLFEATESLKFVSDSGPNVFSGTNKPQLLVQYNGGSFNNLTIQHDDTNGSIGTSAGNLGLVPASGKVGIGTNSPAKNLEINNQFPSFQVTNTSFSQFAGAGFWLVNNVSSMGGNAGVTAYMGIDDAGATQGFFTIDTTDYTGGGSGHVLLFHLHESSGGVTDITFFTGGVANFVLSKTTLTLGDAINLAFGTSTGTKIGASTSQKLSFWNATPIVQPTTGVAAATFVASAGTAVNDASTFDGYTLKQVVKALRNVGLLA